MSDFRDRIAGAIRAYRGPKWGWSIAVHLVASGVVADPDEVEERIAAAVADTERRAMHATFPAAVALQQIAALHYKEHRELGEGVHQDRCATCFTEWPCQEAAILAANNFGHLLLAATNEADPTDARSAIARAAGHSCTCKDEPACRFRNGEHDCGRHDATEQVG